MMIGMLMDSVLLLLLVLALGYGVRLERRLRTLREGQLAFAGAVTELNAAAGRAEAALASLRAAGQETDLLHDRIVKAREAREALEAALRRAPAPMAAPEPAAASTAPVTAPSMTAPSMTTEPVVADARRASSAAADRFTPVLQALAAGRAAKESLNKARRSLDSDLFAA